MDWGAFDEWIARSGRMPVDPDRHAAAARAIVRKLGDEVLPKNVDAFLAELEARGVSVDDLAEYKRAGDDLVGFARHTRNTRRASGAPPSSQTAEAPAPASAPASAPVVEPTAPKDPLAGIDPAVLAKLPAAAFQRRAAAAADDDDDWIVRLARYAWAFDLASVGVGLGLCWLSVTMRGSSSGGDPMTPLLARVASFVGMSTAILGAGRLLQRTGWIDLADLARPGTLVGRAFARWHTFMVLRGFLLIVSLALIPFTIAARGCSVGSRSRPGPELTGWTALLGIEARVPDSWLHARNGSVNASPGRSYRAAYFDDDGAPDETHVLLTARAAGLAEPGAPLAVEARLLAEQLGSELGSGHSARCVAPRTGPHVDSLCTIDAPSPARGLVLACNVNPWLVMCVAWAGPGPTADAARDASVVLSSAAPLVAL